ncbi:MAG: ferritin-like domain-containing protein [Byssovorax sp.]
MPDSPWTEAHLRTHIQRAVELELFTIPAYLCAYYSIRQAASPAAQAAADALFAIANQEMMHLEQACKVAHALGQAPRLTGGAAPSYPHRVPYNSHDAVITLGPATNAQIKCFMQIELPTWHDVYDAPDLPPQDTYETIGELYHALMHGLDAVYGPEGTGEILDRSATQVTGTFPDDKVAVTDLESAMAALEQIVRQGEGGSPKDPHGTDPRELAHYYRLEALVDTLAPGDLRPMVSNSAGLTWSTACGALLDFFDATYSHVLRRLEASLQGADKIAAPVGLMLSALQMLATHLVETPYQANDRDASTGRTLTPRFRYTATTPQQAYGKLDAAARESPNVQAAASALRLVLELDDRIAVTR